MRARIYNKDRKRYYISEVYGVINCGVDMYIVDEMWNPQSVVLVEYLDFSTEMPYDIHVEIIDINPSDHYQYIYVPKDEMQCINDAVHSPNKYHYFRGYDFIWEEKEALIELLTNGTIEKERLSIGDISTKLPDWNYIENRDDIDNLMEQFAGFHDSVLKEFTYVTGDYVDEDNKMHFNVAGGRNIKLVFDSQWASEIEICILSPRCVQLVPPSQNMLADLYDASVFIKDCMVYFYDSYLQAIPEVYDGTYIKAMGVMWRFAEKEES